MRDRVAKYLENIPRARVAKLACACVALVLGSIHSRVRGGVQDRVRSEVRDELLHLLRIADIELRVAQCASIDPSRCGPEQSRA